MHGAQARNDALIAAASVTGDVKATGGRAPEAAFTPEAVRDCMVALIAIKYTQVRGTASTPNCGAQWRRRWQVACLAR